MWAAIGGAVVVVVVVEASEIVSVMVGVMIFCFFFAPGSSSWFLRRAPNKKASGKLSGFELLVYVDILIPNRNLSGQTSRA